MPFLSETLYCALPEKKRTHLINSTFPKPSEVYFTVLNNIYKSVFNFVYKF